MKLLACALCLLTVAATADAKPLNFSLTGTDSVSFTLDSDPTPSHVQVGEYPAAVFTNVTGMYEGAAAIFDLFFFNAEGGGGFQATRYGPGPVTFISPYNQQPTVIFSGSVEHPAFAPGTYLFDLDFGTGAVSDKLVISDPSATPPASPVPEPATWALLVLGFGFIGGSLRFARKEGKSPWQLSTSH